MANLSNKLRLMLLLIDLLDHYNIIFLYIIYHFIKVIFIIIAIAFIIIIIVIALVIAIETKLPL